MNSFVNFIGHVITVAGRVNAGHEDGLGTLATFSNPNAVSIDPEGNVWVADGANNLIRKVNTAGFDHINLLSFYDEF